MSSVSLGFLLFWEFFQVGLFSVGGGPATLPYLIELGNKYNWFSMQDLTNMIAISEFTPGPLGVNMATYVGFQTLGIPGGIIATLGLVAPSIIIICLIAAFFAKVNDNRFVKSAFSAIRPAVTAIIAVAIWGICKVTLFAVTDGKMTPVWSIIILAVIVLALLQIKPLKKIHPFFWFIGGAVVGMAFRL